jgi:hypothetical protein
VVKKLTTDDGLSVFWGLAQTKSCQQIERYPCHKKQEGKDGDKLHITRQTRVAVQFESNLIFKLISIKISGGYEMVGDISTTSDANAMGGDFSGARDRQQHNHSHEFSATLLNQLFQEPQPSNFQRNTIPPLAIIFAINWSVGYWWRRNGY